MKQRLFCQVLLRMPHNPLRWLLEQSFNIKGRQGSENRIIHTIMFPKYTPDDMKPHLFFQLSGTLLGFWSFKSLSASHGVKAKCKGAIVPLGQNCILHFIHFFHKKCLVAGNRIYFPPKIWERPQDSPMGFAAKFKELIRRQKSHHLFYSVLFPKYVMPYGRELHPIFKNHWGSP